jgi:hypothetical protein
MDSSSLIANHGPGKSAFVFAELWAVLCANAYAGAMTYARQYLCGHYCNNVVRQVDHDHHFTSPILEGFVVASNWAELRQTGENLRHPMAHQEPHTPKPCDESSSLEMAGKQPRRSGEQFSRYASSLRESQTDCND